MEFPDQPLKLVMEQVDAMRKIRKAFVNLKLDEDAKRRIKDAMGADTIIFFENQSTAVEEELIWDADVVILSSPVERDILRKAEKLSWLHCDIAGLEKVADSRLLDRGVIITGASGRSAPALAEHVFFFMFQDAYCVRLLMEDKVRHNWNMDTRGWGVLRGKTIGILGTGATGNEVAKRAAVFGMHVLGYNRSHKDNGAYFERMYYPEDRLDGILGESDYIVLTLPLTDETRHIINHKTLAMAKPGAFVINISRGEIIDEGALIEALKSGRIKGAGLDVFEMEPLPAASPLWDLEQVCITPHKSPLLLDKQARSLNIVCDNIRAYIKEQPMSNRAGYHHVYSKGK